MRRIALAALVVVLASACDGGTAADRASAPATEASSEAAVASASTAASVRSPTGDLYEPPDPLEPAEPGTLIWAEEVSGLELDPPASVWRILYHSRSRDDRDIAVSGLAVVPSGPIPEGGRPAYAWAHGTVGLGDQCAPSHEVRDNLPPYGGPQVERGAVLVATDYEGLGTPGIPTLSGVAEGHAVLDSIRAVASLPNVGALGDVVLVGHSQGGRAALFAAEIGSTYAPELRLVGAVALAPGVELPALVDHLAASPYKGAVLMGGIGLRATYPNVALASVFTPSVIADVARVETECSDTTIARYRELLTSDVIAHDPSTVPELQALLEENSPGQLAPSVPVFIGHGDADQQVPVALSGQLDDRYCALGATVIRLLYPGEDHDAVIDAALDDAMTFIADRFDHEPATSTC